MKKPVAASRHQLRAGQKEKNTTRTSILGDDLLVPLTLEFLKPLARPSCSVIIRSSQQLRRAQYVSTTVGTKLLNAVTMSLNYSVRRMSLRNGSS